MSTPPIPGHSLIRPEKLAAGESARYFNLPWLGFAERSITRRDELTAFNDETRRELITRLKRLQMVEDGLKTVTTEAISKLIPVGELGKAASRLKAISSIKSPAVRAMAGNAADKIAHKIADVSIDAAVDSLIDLTVKLPTADQLARELEGSKEFSFPSLTSEQKKNLDAYLVSYLAMSERLGIPREEALRDAGTIAEGMSIRGPALDDLPRDAPPTALATIPAVTRANWEFVIRTTELETLAKRQADLVKKTGLPELSGLNEKNLRLYAPDAAGNPSVTGFGTATRGRQPHPSHASGRYCQAQGACQSA